MTGWQPEAGTEQAKFEVGKFMEKVRLNMDYVQTFQCPDPTGQSVSCWRDKYTDEPIITGPGGDMPCPQHWKVKCPNHVAFMAREAADAQREWEKQAREIGIPSRLWHASFDLEPKYAPLVAAKSWFENEAKQGRALGLLGNNGLGKTMASCAVLRAWKGTRWLVYAGDLATLLLTHSRSEEAEEKAKTVGLLVIDNLGAEYIKKDGMFLAKLDSIVYHREGNHRPMIITSRVLWEAGANGGETLKDRMSADMIDRLGSWMSMVQFNGPSKRRPGA